MPYVAPPGIGDPAVTRAAAAALRRRADLFDAMAQQVRAGRDTVVFEGPGANRYRGRLDGILPVLARQSAEARVLADRLMRAAGAAEDALARERREAREARR